MRITFGKLDRHLNYALWLPLLGLALATSIAAGCGGDSTGSPGSGGSGGSSAGTAGNSAGGNSGGGTTGSAGTGGSGTAGTSVAGTTGTAGNGSGGNSSGTAGAGTAGSSGGNVGSGGNSAGTAGSGTAGSGSGGTAGNGSGGTAQAGRGGASAGSGGSGTAGAGGRGGSGGSAGTTGTGGGTACGACPSNATFCSGFEDASLPSGAVYMVNAAPGEWTRDFAVDTAKKRCGNSSLRVKSESGSGSAYKMLSVPAPSTAFWVRFYVQSDMPMGSVDHNVFAAAATGDSPNAASPAEFAEDVGIGFNLTDADVVWPTGYGRINGNPNPYVLPATSWHCIEIAYDIPGKRVQLFVNGTQLIDAPGHPANFSGTYNRFKFGFNSLHGPTRQMWYDDVIVAPTRIGGCN